MTIDVDRLRKYTIGIPHCYAHPNIPEEMLKNAKEVHFLESDENILFLKDVSVWGSAKNSWIFTNRKISFHYIQNSFSIEYSSVKTISTKGGNIIINNYPKAYVGLRSHAKKLMTLIQLLISEKNRKGYKVHSKEK